MLLDTGLRLGEALSLDWAQVRLEPAEGAQYGYLTILSGKAKSKKSRNVPLSPRAVSVLRRWEPRRSGTVFHRADGKPLQASLLGQQQNRVRTALKLPPDFVLHSLRHTFGTRLGEARIGVRPIDGAESAKNGRKNGHSQEGGDSKNQTSCLISICPGGEIGRRNGLKLGRRGLSGGDRGWSLVVKLLKTINRPKTVRNADLG